MRQVNLVNDKDEIVGHTDLLDAHRGTGKKHQAISWFLFHKKKDGSFELLLQQRSEEKIVGALQWANTLCANLLPGENHLACLKRRAFEELGIEWQSQWLVEEVTTLNYQVACENGFAENELDHFFALVLSDEELEALKVAANPEEVSNIFWQDWSQVKSKQFGDKVLAPWFNLFLDKAEIINKLDHFLRKF